MLPLRDALLGAGHSLQGRHSGQQWGCDMRPALDWQAAESQGLKAGDKVSSGMVGCFLRPAGEDIGAQGLQGRQRGQQGNCCDAQLGKWGIWK